MPGNSSTGREIVSSEELTNALIDGHFQSPINKMGSTLDALKKLSNIFNKTVKRNTDSSEEAAKLGTKNPAGTRQPIHILKDNNPVPLPRGAQTKLL